MKNSSFFLLFALIVTLTSVTFCKYYRMQNDTNQTKLLNDSTQNLQNTEFSFQDSIQNLKQTIETLNDSIQNSQTTISIFQDSIRNLNTIAESLNSSFKQTQAIFSSLQDSIQCLQAKIQNLDVYSQLGIIEKEVEKYRWDFGQTVNDYNDKMSHWLAFLTIILAVVAIGGPYLSNKWSEKNIEKLLKDADKKAEIAQTKAEEVVESVKTDANTAKENAEKAEGFVNAAKKQAEKAEGFVNDAKKEAEKAEGLLSTAKEETEKSLKVVNELKTQIVNELTPLKETANKSAALLNSIQEYFEKIKNSHVENTSDIGNQQIQKEDNNEDTEDNNQQDQIELIKRVKYSDDKKKILEAPKEIEHFEIPEGVTEIGMAAFRDCTRLKSIKIPDSVTEIGDSAFSGCSSLTEIIVDEKNPNYRSKDGVLYSNDLSILIAFPGGRESIKIPDSVTKIEGGAFWDCSSLTSIVIPDGVTEIGDFAFFGCSSLTSIVIPDSVTEIGDGAFVGCKNLTSIVIPNSVTVIGDYAFSGCSSLTSIVIPDSVTKIGWGAFSGCDSLREIHLKHTSPVDFSIAFEDLFDSDKKPDLSKITLYVPKDSVEAYKNQKFYGQFNVEPDKE